LRAGRVAVLAVPAAAACAAAVGTWLQLQYGAALAARTLWDAGWFAGLLGVCAFGLVARAFSRRALWPAGGALLLASVVVSSQWGVRGELRLSEKTPNATVTLPEVALEQGPGAQLQVVERLPYARAQEVYRSVPATQPGSIAVQLRMESASFEVSGWLDSSQRRVIQLGPIYAVLVTHLDDAPDGPSSWPSQTDGRIEVLGSGGEVKGSIRLSQFQTGAVEVDGLSIALTRFFEQALVAPGNRVGEGGTPGANPAADLSVSQAGQTARELVFAHMPEFTLHPGGLFGHTFRYAPAPLAHAPKGASDIVECHVYPGSPDKVRLQLLKGDSALQNQWVKPGESLPTPWQGASLSVTAIVPHGVSRQEAVAEPLVAGAPAPPSAVRVRAVGAPPAEDIWLLEGTRTSTAFYGQRTFELPHPLTLMELKGTSRVARIGVEGQGEHLLPPGESLELGGFRLVESPQTQASRDTGTAVFLVSRDPGRWPRWGAWLLLFAALAVASYRRVVG